MKTQLGKRGIFLGIAFVFIVVSFFSACSSTQNNTDSSSTQQSSKGAAPLYYDFGDVPIPKELSVIDKSTYIIEKSDGSTGHPRRREAGRKRRMILLSVCGFPELDHFDALVRMFRLMSRAGDTPIMGEILRPSSETIRFGERLGKRYERLEEAVRQAGREIS